MRRGERRRGDGAEDGENGAAEVGEKLVVLAEEHGSAIEGTGRDDCMHCSLWRGISSLGIIRSQMRQSSLPSFVSLEPARKGG